MPKNPEKDLYHSILMKDSLMVLHQGKIILMRSKINALTAKICKLFPNFWHIQEDQEME